MRFGSFVRRRMCRVDHGDTVVVQIYVVTGAETNTDQMLSKNEVLNSIYMMYSFCILVFLWPTTDDRNRWHALKMYLVL